MVPIFQNSDYGVFWKIKPNEIFYHILQNISQDVWFLNDTSQAFLYSTAS